MSRDTDYECVKPSYMSHEPIVEYPWPLSQDRIECLPNFDHLLECFSRNGMDIDEKHATRLGFTLPRIVWNGVLFRFTFIYYISPSCIYIIKITICDHDTHYRSKRSVTQRQRNCDVKVSHMDDEGDPYLTYGTILGTVIHV